MKSSFLFLLLTLFSFSFESLSAVTPNEKAMWNYYVVSEFSKESLSVVMGTMKYLSDIKNIYIDEVSKSKLQITAREYVNKVNSGEISYETFISDGVCFGLGGWCNEAHKAKLYKECHDDIGDFECQIINLYKDLKSSEYKKVWINIEINRDLDNMFDILLQNYLIPWTKIKQ